MDEILKKQGFPDMGEITMEQVWDVFNQLNPMEKRSLSSALEVLVEHSNGKIEEVDGDPSEASDHKQVPPLTKEEMEEFSKVMRMDEPDLLGPDRDSSLHSASDKDYFEGKTVIIHNDQLEKTFSMVKLDNDEPPFPTDPNTLHIPFTSQQLSETSNLMTWVGATDMRTFIWEYEAIIRAIFAAWNGDQDVENLEFYLVYYLPFFVSLGVIYSLEGEFGYRTFEVQGLDELEIVGENKDAHQRALAGSWREIRRFAVAEFAAIKDDDEFIAHTMSLLENVAVSKRGGLKRYLSYVARLVSRAQSEREINKCLYGEAGAGGFIDIQDVYNVVVMRLPFKWRLEAENLGNKATSAVEFATILEHTFSKDQDFNARNEELMGGSLFEKNRKKTKKKEKGEEGEKGEQKDQGNTQNGIVTGSEGSAKVKTEKNPLSAETLAETNPKDILESKITTLIKTMAQEFGMTQNEPSFVQNMKLDTPDEAPVVPKFRKVDPLANLRGNNYF
ncbi:hypothetical protein CJU90_1865 [Yarrowia sp. C11]|nr:hypothetical protein CKK34_5893 [Yarrowia sp. E02]KAG5371802.1 hypothetical protein CJU90_1865 [Yarrowia sp. C11]